MDPEKLSNLIRSHGMSLGTSPSGTAWAMKALHPAANTEPIEGIPDRSGIPIAMLEFKSNYSVSSPTSTPYDALIYSFPSPIIFGCAQLLSTAGAPVPSGAGGWQEFNNQQITGATYHDKVVTWHGLIATARLAYMGITINFDAAALTNNGTITAGQQTVGWIQGLNTAIVAVPIQQYAGPTITYQNLINLPLAVQYRAIEGCYMPIKLTNPALPFINQSMDYFYTAFWPPGGGPAIVTGLATEAGYLIPQLCDGQLGAIAFHNVAGTTALRITYRVGFECCPVPGSSYSCFMHPSPPIDSTALDAYYNISAKLYDAYPDVYNDWGKLWEVIKGIASPLADTFLPYLPGGSIIKAGGQALGKVIDSAVQKTKTQANKNKSKSRSVAVPRVQGLANMTSKTLALPTQEMATVTTGCGSGKTVKQLSKPRTNQERRAAKARRRLLAQL